MRLNLKYGQLSEGEFSKIIRKDSGLIIIEFGSEWCGNCQIMEPILIYLFNKYRNEVDVYKVEMETNEWIVKRFGIHARPTFLFFKEGKVVDYLIGSVSKKIFENKIKIQFTNNSITNNLKRRLK